MENNLCENEPSENPAKLPIEKAVKKAVITGLVFLAFTLWGAFSNALMFIDVVILSALVFGVFKRNRTCSVILILYTLYNIIVKVWLYIQLYDDSFPIGIILNSLFLWFFFWGMVAIMSLYKLNKTTDDSSSANVDALSETLIKENSFEAWTLNLLRAKRAIKIAWIVAIITATLTLIATLISSTNYNYLDLSYWSFIDVILILGLAYGIFRKSRICAFTMFVYFVICKIWFYNSINDIYQISIGFVWCYLYFQGLLGTLAFHKIHKLKILADNEESIQDSIDDSAFNLSNSKVKTFILSFLAVLLSFSITFYVSNTLKEHKIKQNNAEMEAVCADDSFAQAMKKYDIELYELMIEEIQDAYNNGDDLETFKKLGRIYGREFGRRHYDKFLSHLSDDSLVRFASISTKMAEQLTEEDPTLTLKWALPDVFGQVDTSVRLADYIDDDLANKMYDEISSIDLSKQTFSSSDEILRAENIINKLRADILAKHNFNEELLNNPEISIEEKKLACEIIIDFYRMIEDLPKEEIALVMRFLFTDEEEIVEASELLLAIEEYGSSDKKVLEYTAQLKSFYPDFNTRLGEEIKKDYTFDWYVMQMVALKMGEQQFKAFGMINDADEANKELNSLATAWSESDLHGILSANFYNTEIEITFNGMLENMTEEEKQQVVDMRPVKALAEELRQQTQ